MPRLGIESAIDGNSRARGLVTYIACARVRDAAWVQEKRPAAADVFSAHFRATFSRNLPPFPRPFPDPALPLYSSREFEGRDGGSKLVPGVSRSPGAGE